MTQNTVAQAQDLHFGWPGRPLFQGWTAAIQGGVTWLGGEESSGKSTLLKLLAGVLPPKAGQISIQGVRLDLDPARYRQQVFWIDPRSETHDQASARTYLAQLPTAYPRFNQEALQDLIEGLSLGDFLDKPMYMLSTGSKRKVWLAGGLASGAALTLIDEPFAALDRSSIRFIQEVLRDAADHGSRAWVVADYAAPEAVPLAGTLLLP